MPGECHGHDVCCFSCAVLEMTPGHEVERREGSGSWEHRQGLLPGPIASKEGCPEIMNGTTPRRDPSRLSRDSSLAGSAAATPTHAQRSQADLADAHVSISNPASGSSSEPPAQATGIRLQV